MPDGLVGRSVHRIEDLRFLTGKGRYVSDVQIPGMLHAVVLRSPHGHARIVRIDTAAARAVQGVHGVVTGEELQAEGIGPLPCSSVLQAVDPLIVPPHHALAVGRVRHVGEAVACVIADSVEAARDAAELIEVEYDPWPAVVDAAAALEPGAPQIWDQAPGNQAFRFLKGDRAATKAAFAAAAHCVELDLYNNRVHACPLEPRAAIGSHDAASDSFQLLLTGQGVHGIQRQLAGAVLRIPPERLRVIAPDVGGGFGLKNVLFPEYVLVLWAARRLGRPVKWVADASEEFPGAVHGRDLRAHVRLALDAEGRFLALDVSMVADMGAYLSAVGPHCPTNAASTAMGGIYDVPAVFMEVRGAFTNTSPVDAYRGAGKPEANYIIECAADAAARQLGLDPVELRRRNAIRTFPHRTAMGMLVDGGRFGANVEEAARLAARDSFEARRNEARQRGKLRGLGLACFLETARGAPNEDAALRFEDDGAVMIAVGTQSNGQGHETTYAQIASDMLGLPLSSFRYVQADTAALRSGAGHGGARSMHLGGGALVKAIGQVLEKARRIAVHLLQASVGEIEFAQGRFTIRGTERGIGLLELARAAKDPANLPDGEAPGLDTEVTNQSDLVTFPNGCHVAEVEIDPETGVTTLASYLAVDDYGRLLNPLLTTGQVQGGVAQGIGQAMLETIVYEQDSGQLLSGSLMDYAIPRADDLPSLEVRLSEDAPTASNALGVKGVGQAGSIAAPQVIMNAVLDALAPLGVRHLDMPATPERVWRAIREASAS